MSEQEKPVAVCAYPPCQEEASDAAMKDLCVEHAEQVRFAAFAFTRLTVNGFSVGTVIANVINVQRAADVQRLQKAAQAGLIGPNGKALRLQRK